MRICTRGREEIHSSRRVPLCQNGGKQLHGCCRVTRCFRRRSCETRRIRNSCTKHARNTHATVLLHSHIHTIYLFYFSFNFIREIPVTFQGEKSGQLKHICFTFFYLLIFPLTLPFLLSGKEGKFGHHDSYWSRFYTIQYSSSN